IVEGVAHACVYFMQAEDGIRDRNVTGVQTCALPISYYYFPIEPEYETRTRSTEATRVQISEEETQELLRDLRYPKDDPEIVKQFESLIREYTDVFKTPSQPLTGTHLVQHRIITDHDKPIAKRPYRVPYHRREILDKEIQKLLDNGIIEESQSPYSFPIILVEKKRAPGEEPEVRICIDYRELNKITNHDH